MFIFPFGNTVQKIQDHLGPNRRALWEVRDRTFREIRSTYHFPTSGLEANLDRVDFRFGSNSTWTDLRFFILDVMSQAEAANSAFDQLAAIKAAFIILYLQLEAVEFPALN